MPPRVMMVIPHYHPVVGGAEKQAQRLAEAMVRRGVAVSVLTGRPRGISREDTFGGVRVRRVGYLDRLRLGTAKFHVQVARMRKILGRLRDEYDVLHCHQGLWTAYAAVRAARRWDKPCLVKFANVGERFDFRILRDYMPGGSLMERYIRRHADRVVATSEAVCRELREAGFGADRIARIPNGVALPELPERRPTAVRESLGMGSDDLLILFVARLERHKHPLTLLNAFERVHREVPSARVVFLGDGSRRQHLERRIAEAGLNGAAHVCGRVDNVSDYLAEADIFVLPSAVEGLSNALLEGMAHGLACVATPAGGNTDLIRPDETGVLVPIGDADALAEVLGRLASDAHLRRRFGRQARALVAREYGIESVVDRYLDLYDQLLTDHGKARRE